MNASNADHAVSPKSITYTALPGIPLVEPGDDLAATIMDALGRIGEQLIDGDIIVIAQKIVSKAEGRYQSLHEIEPTPEALELAKQTGKDPRHVQIVLRESNEILRQRQNVLIVEHRLGYVMANAGIDESNIEHEFSGDRVLLLPLDPDGTAGALKQAFDNAYQKSIGVIITDSFGRPWRLGVVGIALGSAGLPSIVNLIGTPDMFGRPMCVTQIAVADEIAAGASLIMGEAAEGLPVVLVRGFSSQEPHTPAAALRRPRHEDLFR